MDGSNGFAPPARKRNLFAHVVESLGARIVGGALRPGDTLPNEAELGRALGASRSVVREAVKSLAGKGLVEPRARTGTRVLAPMHWNLLDANVLGWRCAAMPQDRFFRELFEIRRMIEPQAAGHAAERRTEADLVELAAACEAMEAAEAGGIDADLRFHRGVLAAGHNDLLLQMGSVIAAGLEASYRICPSSYDVFVPQHRRVFEAIRDRKATAARDRMERLLVETRAFLEGEMRAATPRPRRRPASR
jgi:GntR family transcriptional regulator, galactonate operon transcriptional repressor